MIGGFQVEGLLAVVVIMIDGSVMRQTQPMVDLSILISEFVGLDYQPLFGKMNPPTLQSPECTGLGENVVEIERNVF